MKEEQVQLKFDQTSNQTLCRNDIILFENNLWKCQSQPMMQFRQMDDRSIREIQQKSYTRVAKLELIPKQWTAKQSKIMLKGQQLGLGKVHEIEVIGMRQFQQLDFVKRQLQKGKKIDYKVILCQTHQKGIYLIIGVQLL